MNNQFFSQAKQRLLIFRHNILPFFESSHIMQPQSFNLDFYDWYQFLFFVTFWQEITIYINMYKLANKILDYNYAKNNGIFVY